MKVLFLTKYTRLGASSRVRTFIYLDYLKSRGLECEVSSFFSDKYLLEVYSVKKHNKRLAAWSFLQRLVTLTRVKQFDRVVIEKELIPYFPPFLEILLSAFGVHYIVDYDDAIFHNYDLSSNPIVRKLLSNKIDNVMRNAVAVLAGNDYIKQRALHAGARNVLSIPTVIDIERYSIKTYSKSNKFIIGWIGSPITHKYLAALRPVFQRLAAEFPIQLNLIGANSGIGLPHLERIVPWREESEVEEIRRFNVGIMPLEDNIWERGKCGYKLIQYMGCGVPVIGTPIGVNLNMIVDGVNGFKAVALDDWYQSIRKIIVAGVEYEEKLGVAGRLIVEERYSLQAYREYYYNAIVSTDNTP